MQTCKKHEMLKYTFSSITDAFYAKLNPELAMQLICCICLCKKYANKWEFQQRIYNDVLCRLVGKISLDWNKSFNILIYHIK